MTAPAHHPLPDGRSVLRAQVRAVAIALRTPALLAAALLAVATLLVVGERVSGGGPVDFAPEVSMIPGFLGALLPIAVWRREPRFGPAFLWTLPVDRRRHALLKASAGWAWLMAAVAAFVLWLLLLAVTTGGHVVGEQTVQMLPTPDVPARGALAPSALRAVRWSPNPLLWLVPFTAATVTYLLASAVVIGSRHPLRWVAGVVLAVMLVSFVGTAADVAWLRLLPSNVVEIVHLGRYGLDTVFSARTESLRTAVTLSDGRVVAVWRGLPDVGAWALATLGWTAAGLVALWAAATRHRERR